MYWYLVYTKPRQEKRALENLQHQGYTCYLPMIAVEKIRRGTVQIVTEPLFPRYLFIQLGSGESSQSWSPIRSTKGVSRLVTFSNEPLRVDERLIDTLRSRVEQTTDEPTRLFVPGERVLVTKGPFAGIEGIYQMSDGESRAMVLIELLSKTTRLPIAAANLQSLH